VFAYIFRRFLLAIFVVFIVTLVVFFMVRFLPGDPVLMIISRDEFAILSEKQIQDIRHENGLDLPVVVQYVRWIPEVARGRFGMSLRYNEPVVNLLKLRLPVTLTLGLISFVIANTVGVILGLIAALRRAKKEDTIVTLLANVGITMPIFWSGIMLIYLFGLKLHWLPTNGWTPPWEDFNQFVRHAIMPIFCMSIFTVGAISRQTRSSMLEVIHQDYVRTAWSKGLMERSLVFKHVLKNGLIPIITLAGMQVSQIFGGSVLIETVFNVPGMGRLAVDAVQGLDYAVVQAVILVISTMVVIANLAVDISYGWFDPRIRYA
jgi:peptide/nickel transport system permease protein